ncbi:hypothetical protein DY000_02005992 [Brassica cretica]|uniref:Uncharacterized protein n=1 Tax=Brassica cretica TaxID=69181 RepID=A0ABQ7BWI6_BRACR|nr:hypothetical protein DY000_02005992 [Brassica cretica]
MPFARASCAILLAVQRILSSTFLRTRGDEIIKSIFIAGAYAQSSSSHATGEADQGTIRPPGAKAAKVSGKKTMVEGKALAEFQSMWSIKEQDLAIKERLSKMSLLAKKEPLADYEEALKKKLINNMLSSLDPHATHKYWEHPCHGF